MALNAFGDESVGKGTTTAPARSEPKKISTYCDGVLRENRGMSTWAIPEATNAVATRATCASSAPYDTRSSPEIKAVRVGSVRAIRPSTDATSSLSRMRDAGRVRSGAVICHTVTGNSGRSKLDGVAEPFQSRATTRKWERHESESTCSLCRVHRHRYVPLFRRWPTIFRRGPRRPTPPAPAAPTWREAASSKPRRPNPTIRTKT